MSRTLDLLFQMVNAGELSVGEAREELDARPCLLPRDAVEFLAGWVIERAEQGDHWRAGDPELLPCGCRVSYDREQVDTRCESERCVLRHYLVVRDDEVMA